MDSAISTHSRSVFSVFLDKVTATYELGKPKVLSLLLVSTACPMVLASAGNVSLLSIANAIIGGSLVSSSASVINCIWDMDIDKVMKRTQQRPLVTGRISVQFSAAYAYIIGIMGVLWLAVTLNPLAGFLALAGHLFYVFIYTVWLKRSTPQNIVIGGAAGAVPPLVGWAAVTGSIELEAILLFLLVFLWTPPHFWALALNRNEDYQRANVPMLPVVAGERATQIQMLLYALTLLPTSLLLVVSNSNLGIFSILSFGLSGGYFAYLNYKLYLLGRKLPTPELDEVKTKLAWRIFAFSIIYLMLIFVTIVIDTYI